MKLGFISDLHIDVNRDWSPEDFLITMNKVLQDRDLDYLFIGGDISNHYQKTLSFVEDLQGLSGKRVYFIPGNHDYWLEEETISTGVMESWKVHEIFKNHSQCLMNHPLILDGRVGIVGHCLWYDHSVHAPTFTKEIFHAGKYRMATWQDKRYIDWKMTDPKMSHRFSLELREDLEKIVDLVDQIFVVTHVVALPELAVPMPHKVFDFFNAYIATSGVVDIFDKYPISYAFMGHVHHRYHFRKNDTQFILNSLGYRKQWKSRDIYQEIEAALVEIDLKDNE